MIKPKKGMTGRSTGLNTIHIGYVLMIRKYSQRSIELAKMGVVMPRVCHKLTDKQKNIQA